MLGIFDSGIGGLTVTREIKKALPDLPIVYFGDTARCPWGNKSVEMVRRYSVEICRFLIKKGSKEIVIACNTASTLAGDYLRKKFPQIKFYDVIDPVIEKINRKAAGVRVGVIGTKGTIGSGIYQKKLFQMGNKIEIFARACPLLVPLAEEGLNDKKIIQSLIKEYLSDFRKKKLDFLILGCTHYPLIEEPIRKFMGRRTELVNSAKEIARNLKKNLSLQKSQKTKDIFYFSQLDLPRRKLIQKIMGRKIWMQERPWKN